MSGFGSICKGAAKERSVFPKGKPSISTCKREDFSNLGANLCMPKARAFKRAGCGKSARPVRRGAEALRSLVFGPLTPFASVYSTLFEAPKECDRRVTVSSEIRMLLQCHCMLVALT